MLKMALTGESKGKTTGATGLLLKHALEGKNCLCVQYLKGGGFSGEVIFLRENFENVMVVQIGKHSIFSENIKEGTHAPGMDCFIEVKGYEKERKKMMLEGVVSIINSRKDHLILLDELITAYWLKYITLHEIDLLIKASFRAGAEIFIATGRGMTTSLAERFDIILENKMLKHPFHDSGLVGRYGIEY